jgi:transposase
MIALASGLRVYLACGVTDMRKGMVGLSMLVQQTLAEDPFGGAVFAFRGRRAGLIKLIWHDGVGLCMLTKRQAGQFARRRRARPGGSCDLGATGRLLDGCGGGRL